MYGFKISSWFVIFLSFLDPIHLTIGTGQYHNGEWHSLLIKRYGSKVTLKVDQKYVFFSFSADIYIRYGIYIRYLDLHKQNI